VNLAAKVRGQPVIVARKLLEDVSRDELVSLVCSLVLVEPAYRPREVAALVQRPRDVVLQAINRGEMGDVFKFGENSLTVLASGVNSWRDKFKVSVAG
jgi:hypothetical protein